MIHITGLILVGLGVFCLLHFASQIAVYIAFGLSVHADSKPKSFKVSGGWWTHAGVAFITLGIGLMAFG